MLESEVESAVVRYAEERGCVSLKLNGEGNRGKPDRAFFYKGRCLIREVKRPGEKPTVGQLRWLERFTAAGFDAGWFDTIGKGKTALDGFIERTDNEDI